MKKIEIENYNSVKTCGGWVQEELTFNEDYISYPEDGMYQFVWEGVGEYPNCADEMSGFRLVRSMCGR